MRTPTKEKGTKRKLSNEILPNKDKKTKNDIKIDYGVDEDKMEDEKEKEKTSKQNLNSNNENNRPIKKLFNEEKEKDTNYLKERLSEKFGKKSNLNFEGLKSRVVNVPSFQTTPKERELFRKTFDNLENNKKEEDEDGKEDKEEEEEDEDDLPKKKKKTASKSKKTTTKKKFTPLELQYIKVRDENPGVVLAVEVGYKYHFYGEDAKTASKVLNFVAYNKGSFLTVTIPKERLLIHLERLIVAGHKVGVVSQTETAALKSISDKKSGVFERKLTQLYSSSTFIPHYIEEEQKKESTGTSVKKKKKEEEEPTNNIINELPKDMERPSEYLVCFAEEDVDQKDSSLLLNLDKEEIKRIGMIGMCVSTGEIVYDVFEDNFSRSFLESRLSHFSPVEIIHPKDISSSSKKLVSYFISTYFKNSPKVSSHLSFSNLNFPSLKKYLSSFFKHDDSLSTFVSENGLKGIGKGMSKGEKMMEEILKLPSIVVKSVVGVLKFLEEFKIKPNLSNLIKYGEEKSMLVDLNCIENLNLFRVGNVGGIYNINTHPTTKNQKNSLFDILNHTLTPCGERLLKKWICKPLIDVPSILLRQRCIQQFSSLSSLLPSFLPLLKVFKEERRKVDLEKELNHIYYKRISPKSFLLFLRSFLRYSLSFLSLQSSPSSSSATTSLREGDSDKEIEIEIKEIKEKKEDINKKEEVKKKEMREDINIKEMRENMNKKEMREDINIKEMREDINIKEMREDMNKKEMGEEEKKRREEGKEIIGKIEEIEFLEISERVEKIIGLLDEKSAEKGDLHNLFLSSPSSFPSIYLLHKEKKELENQFTPLLSSSIPKGLLSKLKKVEYVTKSGISHLIEIPLAHLSLVPSDWLKISQTKLVHRFHPPQVIKLLKSLKILEEKLSSLTKSTWLLFLGMVSENYVKFKKVIDLIALFDCYQSLGIVAQKENYIYPSYDNDDKREIVIEDGRHPIVEEKTTDPFISNSLSFTNKNNCLILTGPNMGGKSTYIRQIGLILIMAQIGCAVPAREANLSVVDKIFTRMGAKDDLTRGQSTFFVELIETSNILKNSTPRSLCLIDELGRGTNTHDGTAIAYSVMEYLMKKECFVLFVTHYPFISKLEMKYPNKISNFHMSFYQDVQEENNKKEPVIFLYKLRKGICETSFGLNVARLAFGNFNPLVIDNAEKKANIFEVTMTKRQNLQYFTSILSLIQQSDIQGLRNLF